MSKPKVDTLEPGMPVWVLPSDKSDSNMPKWGIVSSPPTGYEDHAGFAWVSTLLVSGTQLGLTALEARSDGTGFTRLFLLSRICPRRV
jgi:hypothetical protein